MLCLLMCVVAAEALYEMCYKHGELCLSWMQEGQERLELLERLEMDMKAKLKEKMEM